MTVNDCEGYGKKQLWRILKYYLGRLKESVENLSG
jgi:hypothetical protein